MAVMTMLVVACSGGGDDVATPGKPDTPSPTPGMEVPILFAAGQQNEVVTRSYTPLETIATSFVVYGFKNNGSGDYQTIQTVFPGYTVKWIEYSANTTVTNTDGWEYVNQQPQGESEQTIKYWDMGAAAYRFFGHIGVVTQKTGVSDLEPGEIILGDGADTKTVSFVADATTQDDIDAAPYISQLWYSDDQTSFGQPVQLVFLKPFARVRFMFTQADSDAALLLTDKSFAPNSGETIVTSCDITVAYPLKGSEIQESYSKTNVSGIQNFTEDYSTTNERWYNVVAPQSLGAFTLTVKVNGTEKTAVVPAEYMNWLCGYQYTYVFKITEQGGVEIDLVQSGFTAWTGMESDHTVFNWARKEEGER